jgi:hypothetical protein
MNGSGGTPPSSSESGASPLPEIRIPGAPTAVKGPAGGIEAITITFRAISLNSIKADANKELLYSVLNEIKSSPLFDQEGTTDMGSIGADEAPGTFTFGIRAKLKRPFKL